MLTKQQKLAILSKAIDEGANVDIYFHNLTKEDAKRITDDIAVSTGEKVKHTELSNSQVYKIQFGGLYVAAFFDKESGYMVEDVVRTIEEEVN